VAAPESGVEEVAGAILDGTSLDWAEVESRSDQTDRPLLEQLKLLARLRTVARATDLTESSKPAFWGHLRVFERIGRGAFGEVYRGWDTRLDREVALKLLPVDADPADASQSSIIEEGRLLARVRHPNVVTIYGAERIGDRIGLWMEFIKGRTLDQMPSEGKVFTDEEVVSLGLELCKAVSAVHGAGLLHRDIKAQNVMVADDGRVLLMDFGTGRELTDGAERGVAGTPLYLAPEVLAGETASPRSEIYSIGVLLYWLATRSYPVRAKDLTDLRQAHARRERIDIRSARPDLPARLARVIERAIDPEAGNRHESADAVAKDLAAIRTRPRFVRVAYAAGVTLVLILIVWGGWQLQGRSGVDDGSSGTSVAAAASDATSGTPVAAAVPLLSVPGEKNFPALSPDGSQLAFTWQPTGYGANLYVKRLDAEGVLQLTRISGGPSYPAWSPDGQFIAFLHAFRSERGVGGTAIRIVPAAGGSVRTLWTGERDLIGRRGLDWSPDGTQLVSTGQTSPAGPTQLILMSVATGEIEWLTAPLPAGSRDVFPVFSPDGRTVAFVRESGTQAEIHLLSLEDRKPRRLRVAQSRIRRLAWSAGGRSLFFASAEGMGIDKLWKVSVPDAQLEPVSGTGAGATEPAVARGAGRLVFLQNAMDQNLYRADLGAGPSSSPHQLVGTTRSETQPDISSDGSRIAFISDRTGYAEIWTIDPRGGDAAQVTNLQSNTRHPRWSPDGRRLTFEAREPAATHQDIYVVDAAGGRPHRLTENPGADQWPTWSRDGKWVYFTSSRTGDWQIWKVPVVGGPAVQVTTNRAVKARESRDGRFLFYAHGTRAIWRMPVAGGDSMRIFEFADHVDWGGEWVVTDHGLYFLNVGPSRRPTIELFDFSTGRTTPLITLPAPYDIGSSFAVSPDGTWLIYPQRDFVKSEIMMIDVDR
jgi:Tol biopolymer transport system component/predicted Ser/Thr protein kinase